MASPFFRSAAEAAAGASAAATSPSVAPATNDLNQAASEDVCRKLSTASGDTLPAACDSTAHGGWRNS